MRKFFKCFVFLLGFITVAAIPARAEELDSSDYLEIGETIDAFEDVGSKVSDVTNSLDTVLAKTNNDQTRDLIMGLLDNVGVDGGWAKQLGKLRDIEGSMEYMSDALTNLSRGATGLALIDAYNKGNRDEFQDIVADTITSEVASWIGDKVSNVLMTKGQAYVAVSVPGGPIAIILAEAGVLVGGWMVGEGVEALLEWTVNETALREYLEQLGGFIFDSMKENVNDAASDDPFNLNPETSPGDDGNGQMCPIPNNGNNGSSRRPVSRRRGGGGDTSARIW